MSSLQTIATLRIPTEMGKDKSHRLEICETNKPFVSSSLEDKLSGRKPDTHKSDDKVL